MLIEVYEDIVLRQGYNFSRIYSFIGVSDVPRPSAKWVTVLLGNYSAPHPITALNGTRAVLRERMRCSVERLRWWLRSDRPARLELWEDFSSTSRAAHNCTVP